MAEFSVLAPRDAGISSVSSLRLSLLAVMDKAAPEDTIVLDLSKLASADSSLAQLVLAFRLEAKLRTLKAVVEGEDSRHSISALLGCDVVCEACTFNDLRVRAASGSGSAAPEVQVKAGASSRTKGAKV